MSNQNKHSLIKLRAQISFVLSLAMVFFSLSAKAQIPFSSTQNKNSQRVYKPLGWIQGSNHYNLDLVQSQQTNQKPEEEPLDFSSSGRSGQQTAGESRGSCPVINFPLTAIAPKSNVSKTMTSHPRWWFFLPYSSSQINQVEFVLQDEERNDLVRNIISVPDTLSYLSTTIPHTHPGIEPNRWYRWYLKVYCVGRKNTVPLFVSGWVQKVKPDVLGERLVEPLALTAVDYAQKDLWLDAINLLMKSEMSEASASHVSQMWQKIMSSPEINLELPQPATANIVIK